MSTPPPTLAQVLRDARGTLTRRAFVEQLEPHGVEIHPQSVLRYESAVQIPPAPVLHAYSLACGLDAADLLRLASQSASK